MEREHRAINSKKELESVRYVRTKPLQICFIGKSSRILLLERITSIEGDVEFVVSEMNGTQNDVIKTLEGFSDAKQFVIEELSKLDIVASVTEERLKPTMPNPRPSQPPKPLTEGVDMSDEVNSKKDARAKRKEKRQMRGYKKDLRRIKLYKIYILILNGLIGFVLGYLVLAN